jgi:hypothetical protein
MAPDWACRECGLTESCRKDGRQSFESVQRTTLTLAAPEFLDPPAVVALTSPDSSAEEPVAQVSEGSRWNGWGGATVATTVTEAVSLVGVPDRGSTMRAEDSRSISAGRA